MKNSMIVFLVIGMMSAKAQSKLMQDSLFAKVKLAMEDTTFMAGSPITYRLDVLLNSYCNEETTTLYYKLLNEYKVSKNVSYKDVRNQMLYNAFYQAVNGSVIVKPAIGPYTDKFIDSTTNIICKFLAKQKDSKSYLNSTTAVKSFDSIEKEIFNSAYFKQIREKMILERLEPKVFEQKYIGNLLSSCKPYRDYYFSISQFGEGSIFKDYLTNYRYIGRYFDKMLHFYKTNNFEKLTEKFPTYQSFNTSLLDLSKLKAPFIIDTKRKLEKLPNGKWQLTDFVTTSDLEDNNKYAGTLIYTFDNLAAKPTIAAIIYQKASAKATIVPQKEFLAAKSDLGFDIPLPPPLPEMTAEELAAREKRIKTLNDNW